MEDAALCLNFGHSMFNLFVMDKAEVQKTAIINMNCLQSALYGRQRVKGVG